MLFLRVKRIIFKGVSGLFQYTSISKFEKRHQLTLYDKRLHGGCPIKGFDGVRAASFCLVLFCVVLCVFTSRVRVVIPVTITA